MSNTVTPFPPQPKSNNPFDIFHTEAIRALSDLKVPGALASYPMPRDFIAVRDYLTKFAEICDALAENVGIQVKHTASYNVDLKLFKTPFFTALDGMALYEIEEAAQHAAAEMSGEELA